MEIDFDSIENKRLIADASSWAHDNGVAPFEYGIDRLGDGDTYLWTKMSNTQRHKTLGEYSFGELIAITKKISLKHVANA